MAIASSQQAPRLPNGLPVPGAYRTFLPSVGGYLVVQLGGETMRCLVERVVSQDAVLARIGSAPMAKSHSFRFDEIIGVRRRVMNEQDVWEAQNDRDFFAEQARMTKPVEKPKPVEAPKMAAKPKSKPKPVKKTAPKAPVKKPAKKKAR